MAQYKINHVKILKGIAEASISLLNIKENAFITSYPYKKKLFQAS